ncbi:D-glycero-alpha-D-manno-heptose-1,7-bisphosphate 7-phosphatase [Streptomyces mexicanus]|uniref:D-glycero-alpha-D-manno-heptose-1,7-bisphosphate 7-phosphatase n=1 Tax=Streptomyces mexicanus TaxID=178566 RepID=UPI0036AE9C96
MNRIKAVLFDRDGTLVEDVPYNGDPERVRPVEGAREAVRLLRERGIGVGVVTNQSGVARGLIGTADVRRVNERIDDLLGPFDVWAVCPHGPDDGCHCRKPQPGLILWAAGRLCTAPRDLVVIGDIGADVEAARRAGAQGVLVPTPVTRPEETAAADHVAPDLLTAVQAVLSGPPPWDLAPSGAPVAAPHQRDVPDAGAGPRESAAPGAHPQHSRTGRTGADARRPEDPATGQAAASSATAPRAAAGRAVTGGSVTEAPGGSAMDATARPATDATAGPGSRRTPSCGTRPAVPDAGRRVR